MPIRIPRRHPLSLHFREPQSRTSHVNFGGSLPQEASSLHASIGSANQSTLGKPANTVGSSSPLQAAAAAWRTAEWDNSPRIPPPLVRQPLAQRPLPPEPSGCDRPHQTPETCTKQRNSQCFAGRKFGLVGTSKLPTSFSGKDSKRTTAYHVPKAGLLIPKRVKHRSRHGCYRHEATLRLCCCVATELTCHSFDHIQGHIGNLVVPV